MPHPAFTVTWEHQVPPGFSSSETCISLQHKVQSPHCLVMAGPLCYPCLRLGKSPVYQPPKLRETRAFLRYRSGWKHRQKFMRNNKHKIIAVAPMMDWT